MPAKIPSDKSSQVEFDFDKMLKEYGKSFKKSVDFTVEGLKKASKETENLEQKTQRVSDALNQSSIDLHKYLLANTKAQQLVHKSLKDTFKDIKDISTQYDYLRDYDPFERFSRGSEEIAQDIASASKLANKLSFKQSSKELLGLTQQALGFKTSLLNNPLFDNAWSGAQKLQDMSDQLHKMQSLVHNPELDSDQKKILEATISAHSESLKYLTDSIKNAALLGASYQLSLSPLKEMVELQHNLQKEISFTNVSYSETSKYISDISAGLIEARGLMDYREGSENFALLTKQYKDFGSSQLGLLGTVNKLNIGIGMSSDSMAELALNMRQLNVEDYSNKFQQLGDQVTWFVKNNQLNLTTQDVQQLIKESEPLVKLFPAQLKKDLIPEILSIGAAFKSVGLDANSFIEGLRDLGDVSSKVGMLKAALMTGRGVTFEDVATGRKLGLATANLLDQMRSMMGNVDGFSARMTAQALSRMTGMKEEEILRLSRKRMTDSEFKDVKSKLHLSEEMSKATGAAQKAMDEQMSGIINGFKSLWGNVKILLMQGAASLGFLLQPISWVLSGLNKLTSALLKIPGVAKVAGIALVGLGIVLGVRLTVSLVKATISSSLLIKSLHSLSAALFQTSIFAKKSALTSKASIVSDLLWLLPFSKKLKVARSIKAGESGAWVFSKALLSSWFVAPFKWLLGSLKSLPMKLGLSSLLGWLSKNLGFKAISTALGTQLLKKSLLLGVPIVGAVTTALWALWDVMDYISKGSLSKRYKEMWRDLKDWVVKPFKGIGDQIRHSMSLLSNSISHLFHAFSPLIDVLHNLFGTTQSGLSTLIDFAAKLGKELVEFTVKGQFHTIHLSLQIIAFGLKTFNSVIEKSAEIIEYASTKIRKVMDWAAEGSSFLSKWWESGWGVVTKALGLNTQAVQQCSKSYEEERARQKKTLMEGLKLRTAYDTSGLDTGRAEYYFNKDRSLGVNPELVNTLQKSLIANSQLKFKYLEDQRNQELEFQKAREESIKTGKPISFIKKEIPKNGYDPLLFEKLTSKFGGKATVGESTGSITVKNIIHENGGKTVAILADGSSIELHPDDASRNAVMGVRDLFIKAKEKAQKLGESNQLQIQSLTQQGDLDIESFQRAGNTDIANASKYLDNVDKTKLEIQKNQYEYTHSWSRHMTKQKLEIQQMKEESTSLLNVFHSAFDWIIKKIRWVSTTLKSLFSFSGVSDIWNKVSKRILPDIKSTDNQKIEYASPISPLQPITNNDSISPITSPTLEYPEKLATPIANTEIKPESPDIENSVSDLILENLQSVNNTEDRSENDLLAKRREEKRLRFEQRRSQLMEVLNNRNASKAYCRSLLGPSEDSLILT
jgi:hypothetical protein